MVDFGQKIGSKVIIGLIRGRYRYESSLEKEKINILSSMKKCCKIAEKNDVQLLFEPINRFEIDSYNTIAQAKELVEEIASDHLKLLIDSFHTNLEEDPVYMWDELRKISHHIGHVHLSDTTRRDPGSGHFDFKTFLLTLKNTGYDDFYSLETIMKPSFNEVAENSLRYLRSII